MTSNTTPKAKAKLYYYGAAGRANMIRLTLAASGIEWDDIKPAAFPPTPEEKAHWRSIGKNTTTNVPMLVTSDGRVYSQSTAVLRAVARMGKLYPDTEEGSEYELYLVDKIMADADDLRSVAYGTFVNWGASQESADAFIDTTLELHMGNLERQLEGEYFVGSKMSVVDISVYDAVMSFGIGRVPQGHATILPKYPKLQALTKRVESHEKIQTYLASEANLSIYKFGPETLGK
eukprot:CAMPEP_0194357792 /NCGR_PEP_ID=MMETSP0174-20130528/5232_1 /TAXON_ID=216777 /ORGANISM="Proboscia alata, Strain PI-D3" /LENGTH=232 /DNA_ID=CAMNT_0039127963 /DNA_START=111 /DNA_END=809 /DNA_ORIENTATION=+